MFRISYLSQAKSIRSPNMSDGDPPFCVRASVTSLGDLIHLDILADRGISQIL